VNLNDGKLLKTKETNSLVYEKVDILPKLEQNDVRVFSIYTYSVSNNLVKKCSKSLNISIRLTENINEAEVILGLKSHLKDNLLLVLSAKKLGIPIYSIYKNTMPQITQILSDISQ
jgi:hypothetical protein